MSSGLITIGTLLPVEGQKALSCKLLEPRYLPENATILVLPNKFKDRAHDYYLACRIPKCEEPNEETFFQL